MNRTTLSMVFCVASVAAFSTFAADLSAAQVAERNAAAHGGLEAWRAVKTLTMSGEMDAGGKQETKLPFVISMKRPHKSRVELRFQDQTAVQTYDGAQGWKLRPYLGRNDVDAFTAAEAKSAAAADELDGPLVDYAKKGAQLEMLGMDTVEGKSTYKLRLTKKGSEARNVWVDASTFLEVKIDGEPRRLDGRLHKVAVFFRDFKTVSGLTIPHTLETAVEGVKQTHKMTVQTVRVNPTLEDTLFAKPQVALARAVAQK